MVGKAISIYFYIQTKQIFVRSLPVNYSLSVNILGTVEMEVTRGTSPFFSQSSLSIRETKQLNK